MLLRMFGVHVLQVDLRISIVSKQNQLCVRMSKFQLHGFYVHTKNAMPLLLFRYHRPLTTYAKLRVTHTPGMPGTFSSPPRVSDPDMHHCTCVAHVPWYMPESLTSGFLWSRCHSRRMRNPQFCASGKRPISNDDKAIRQALPVLAISLQAKGVRICAFP